VVLLSRATTFTCSVFAFNELNDDDDENRWKCTGRTTGRTERQSVRIVEHEKKVPGRATTAEKRLVTISTRRPWRRVTTEPTIDKTLAFGRQRASRRLFRAITTSAYALSFLLIDMRQVSICPSCVTFFTLLSSPEVVEIQKKYGNITN